MRGHDDDDDQDHDEGPDPECPGHTRVGPHWLPASISEFPFVGQATRGSTNSSPGLGRLRAVPGAGAAAAISVHGLRMRYGDRDVLKGIDLEVRSGEVFGFLGPNGAGKTTTIEILEGYRK